MSGVKSYKDWEKFAETREKFSVFVTPEEIFYMSPLDKNQSSKSYVERLFLAKGVEVYRYRHNYDATRPEDYFGLVFHRTDSDFIERMEITALIGVNARRVDAAKV